MPKFLSLCTFVVLAFATTAKADIRAMNDFEPSKINLESTGSYYDWGRAQNGWGFCYEWTPEGYVLNNGQPVSDYLCEARRPSHYAWGRAQNGWGFCYHYTPNGYAMNNGQPVSNYLCEAVAPSYYSWGRAQNGNTYCYQYTPNGYSLNNGQPVSDYLCRR